MHDDEIEVSDDVVRRLLADQLPDSAALPLTRLDTWGTDHVIYRLGDDFSVRLPKIGWAAEQGERERRWLPMLAPHLPVQVPSPVFVGEPAYGYPFPWYVAPWIHGANPQPDGDLRQLAADLGAFVRALHNVDVADVPIAADGQRGGPLQPADASIRSRAEQLRHETDVDALLAVWDAGRLAPAWDGPPRLVHGDLMDGNLLVRDGRLVGVIDWTGPLAGDPAIDLIAGWSLFDCERRGAYFRALGFVDGAMWRRGRAWAVSAAVEAIPYYRDTNPDIVERSWRAIRAVLEKT
jgi:aminoglycoside phosphotransferase (APT) family kinase protein